MTREQEMMSGIAKTVFRLNGQFISIGELLARPGGLTAAWWQVLATVLRAPMTVAEIAREVGVTRQSVQRIADVLVERGLGEYRPNPAHRRAKLLAATEAGRASIRRIAPGHAAFAQLLADRAGATTMEETLLALRRISDILGEVEPAKAGQLARSGS
jgi:DNA-binding MarR family transcriptional regulator